MRPGRWSRARATSWYIVLAACFGSISGVLLGRLLFPMVRESNFFLLLVVISLFVVGIVLTFRAYRRGAGS
jgi:uncharacterized membrane protein YfcA